MFDILIDSIENLILFLITVPKTLLRFGKSSSKWLFNNTGRVASVALLVTLLNLVPWIMGSNSPFYVYRPFNGKVEQVFMDASYDRRAAMPGGWCDIESRQIGANSDEDIKVYQFAKGEVYFEDKHIPHGAHYFTGFINDFDTHYLITSSTSGVAKFRVSMWHLYTGRSLTALAPDAVEDFDITVTAGDDINEYKSNYLADFIELTAWQPNRTIHDQMLLKFERLSTGDGDTYAGLIDILHVENFNPEVGVQWHGN